MGTAVEAQDSREHGEATKVSGGAEHAVFFRLFRACWFFFFPLPDGIPMT